MSTTYYIKAYFTKQGQNQQEIRRFAIDISPQNDAYQELQTKIASFQLNDDFTLQYLDEENERITFNSNEELRSAIDINKDTNTLKVFVTLNQSIPQQQGQETRDKELHVGVECDGCRGPVRGFRYKCFVCPNYDLCETCSAAGVHSEHNMIKITKPGNFHHPHPHPHPHHMPPPPPPTVFPSREFIEQVQSRIPQWIPNGANSAHFRTHLQQHLDSIKANTQTHMQNSKQYLESVGQYLQQTLSPFGIDCNYHVDERNATTNQEPQPEQASTNQQEEQNATTNEDATRETDAVPKYPDLTSTTNNEQQSTPIKDPIESAIDDCLEKMQAMGFVDTNGRLRELIRSKQGEMNAVLDAINPRHYQQ